jgi:hypothetical protein
MIPLLFAALVSEPAFALPPRGGAKFGVGVGGGLGVSGLSGKFWLKDKNALQLVVGAWGVGRSGYGYGLGVGLDYLWEMPAITRADPVLLAWNLGLGGTVGAYDPGWIGVSGVAGLEFDFQPVPIDVTLEYRPGIAIVPAVGVDLVNFTGHVRIHF